MRASIRKEMMISSTLLSKNAGFQERQRWRGREGRRRLVRRNPLVLRVAAAVVLLLLPSCRPVPSSSSSSRHDGQHVNAGRSSSSSAGSVTVPLLVTAQATSTYRSATCSLERFEPAWIVCHEEVTTNGEDGPAVPIKKCEIVPYGADETTMVSSSSSLNETRGDNDVAFSPKEETGATAEPFRICDCTYVPYDTDYYCPMPATDHCHVPRRQSYHVYDVATPRTTPFCLRRPGRYQEFAESIWPILVVTLAAIVACLCCSRGGHRSVGHIVGWCFPCLVTLYIDYLVRYRPRRAQVMIRRWIRRRSDRLAERYNEIMNGNGGGDDDGGHDDERRSNNNNRRRRRRRNHLTAVEETLLRESMAHQRNGRPHMLRLATRIFREGEHAGRMTTTTNQQQRRRRRHPAAAKLEQTESTEETQSHNDIDAAADDDEETRRDVHEEDDEDVNQHDDHDDNDADDLDGCMICFAPLCDGDRVGSLPCKHLFHVHCLKTWLKRRNVCPLCLCEEAAEEVTFSSTTTSV